MHAAVVIGHPQTTCIIIVDFPNTVLLYHHPLIPLNSLPSPFIHSLAFAGGNGGLQTAGDGCTAVSERPPATRGGSGQSAYLPYGSDSAARGQPTAAHHHPAM